MRIIVTGQHVEVTPALKAFSEEKLSKLEHHVKNIQEIHLVLRVEKNRQIADATAHVVKGEIHASTDSGDMYTSIDLLVDKLDKQLIKYKEKRTDHHE
jgi:putative sigma-54 modulation protein